MQFIGCVRSLMARSGLVDILPCAFRGVDHMLTGNNFTYNFHAMRLLVETVIHYNVQEANYDDDLISRLQHHATSSTTANVWAVGLIKPVFLIMICLSCLGPLAPQGVVGARHGLPHQLSPLLPVVCQGLSFCEGFAGPVRYVVSPPLFRHTPSSPAFDCLRLFPVVPLSLGRPILSSPHNISIFATLQLPDDILPS